MITLRHGTIETTPQGGPTPLRGLTHSLDSTKEGLAIEGCTSKHEAKGLCNKHYLRSRTRRRPSAQDRDLSGEEWRPVVGYEGHYEVSDMGRVRSLTREVQHIDGVWHQKQGRILRQWIGTGNGYSYVSLKQGGTKANWCVHRLVALAFLGPQPEGQEVCHGNGNRRDARLVNLRWDTHSANMFDRRRDGTDRNVAKTHCPRMHRLAGSNIQRDSTGASRHCKACNRARAKFGFTDHPQFVEEADRQYRRIMGAAA